MSVLKRFSRGFRRVFMTFFNQETSNIIQFISMAMEIIGITLAYIEIRYRPFAMRIESRILDIEVKIKEFAWKIVQNNLFSVLITLFVMVVFFFERPYMAGFFDTVLPENMKQVQEVIYWCTFPIVVLFLACIFLIFLSEFVSWLNRFSDGHAIGSLGVVVTGIGLTGEIYQVFSIFYAS